MSNIQEKIEERLQAAQASKEFKDVGRVSDLKKTKAAYRLIDMSNLSEIEADEVQAYNIVKKDLVWQPIDVNSERDKGVTGGATWLKIKIREAVPTKPDNNKNKRASYVNFLTKLQGDLAECFNVEQIEDLGRRYKKLPLNDIISYLLDPSYAEKSEEDKKAIEELVKKNYRLAMIYGSERLMNQLIEEVFSKRFANILFNKGDTSFNTYLEAKDKEPITEQQSSELIEKIKARKKSFEEANRVKQENYRNYDANQLKQAMVTDWQLSPASKVAYKEDIEKFRTFVIDFYERRIKKELELFDKKIEDAKPKGNDWSWSEATKEKSEKKSSENKLILNKKEPLSYIKRTGGYKIGEISPSELIDKFGFKAVNYGNYVDDKWSKQHTKFFLQAMSDMGEIFNINIKELNNLGGLNIVFGGKGRKGHLATYFPQTKDINLTKANGDGSVGHEYGHYFDNVIIDLDQKKAVPLLATENINQVINPDLKQAIGEIVDFFKKGNPLYTPKMKVKFFSQPSEIAPTIPFYKDKYWQRKPIEFKPTIEETLEQCQEMLVFDENLYQSQVRVIGYIINHYGLLEYEVDIRLKTSMYYQKSAYNFFTYCYKVPAKYNPNRIEIVKAGDKRTPYWTSEVEMFARGWETVLFKKILDKNRRSDYLVSGIDMTDLNIEGFQNPYPSGSELNYLETLYDKLIVSVKKAFNLSDFVPYNTDREDTLVEFENKNNPEIKTGIDVKKGKKEEVVDYIQNDKVVKTATENKSEELQKGIEVEQEHKSTLESVASGEITPEQAIVETAKEHISENPNYYKELEKIDKKVYPNIKDCLIADDDNENDFIVEGTKIYNNEGIEEWEVIGFYKEGMVLKHNPKTKLTNEKGVKEVTFRELKEMFSKNLVSIRGINGGDLSRLNVCIKAIQGCMDRIDAEKYKSNLEKEVEDAKKQQAESPSKIDMSEFYKIVRESKDFEDAFAKARMIKGVNPETATYFYSKYNPNNNKSGKETFKTFYEEVRGVDKVNATPELISKAYEFGKKAHDEEKQRTPAFDKNVRELISGLKFGEASKVLESWLKGWDDARRIQLREKFPEMYAPKMVATELVEELNKDVKNANLAPETKSKKAYKKTIESDNSKKIKELQEEIDEINSSLSYFKKNSKEYKGLKLEIEKIKTQIQELKK